MGLSSMSRLQACLHLALAMGLAACASAPPSAPAPDAPPAVPAAPSRQAEPGRDRLDDFERELQAHAQRQLRAACLADAVVGFEILALLRPGSDGYRQQLADLKQRVDARVAEVLERAAQQRKRGDTAAAEQAYLEVLVLQPDHAPAMAALRELEVHRNRRAAVHPTTRLLPPAATRSAASAKAARSGPDYEALLSRQGAPDTTAAASIASSAADHAGCMAYEDWARQRAARGAAP